MTKILIDEAVVRQWLEWFLWFQSCRDEKAPMTSTQVRDSMRQALANAALDKMAENARELGLTYEQPAQQEPVAWGIIASNTGRICQVELDADEVEGHNPKHIVPLYTTPPAPAQEPDPDELTIAYMSGLHEGKKIGAKEGRNKLATWMMQCGFATGHGDTVEELLYELDTEIEDRLAAKDWVGLTRDEVLEIEEETTHPLEFYRAIEAKLKEKNK